MSLNRSKIKPTVATLVATVMISLPAWGEDDVTGVLLGQLQTATPAESKRITRELRRQWSKSGSASIDLLLKRGRDAIAAEDFPAAIEHLSALTDHAPDFAEGWMLRATAFYRQEKYGLAVNDLEHTLTLNPSHFGAIRGLGAIFEQLGKPEQAYEAYQQALAINPHDSEAEEAAKRLAPLALGREL